jgi:peroxiredoxin Q/BCP
MFMREGDWYLVVWCLVIEAGTADCIESGDTLSRRCDRVASGPVIGNGPIWVEMQPKIAPMDSRHIKCYAETNVRAAWANARASGSQFHHVIRSASMRTVTLFCSVVFALAWAIHPAAAAELKVGDKAPDFELKGSDGKLHHLGDFKDKQAVVVAWFPKAFTGGCTAECKSMKENGAAIRKFDVVYFTASVDPFEGDKGNKAFAESLTADYPILSDPEGKTAKDYGVLNGSGMANRWTFYIGKDGKVAAIEKKINTSKAGEDVVAKLKELKVAEKK